MIDNLKVFIWTILGAISLAAIQYFIPLISRESIGVEYQLAFTNSREICALSEFSKSEICTIISLSDDEILKLPNADLVRRHKHDNFSYAIRRVSITNQSKSRAQKIEVSFREQVSFLDKSPDAFFEESLKRPIIRNKVTIDTLEPEGSVGLILIDFSLTPAAPGFTVTLDGKKIDAYQEVFIESGNWDLKNLFFRNSIIAYIASFTIFVNLIIICYICVYVIRRWRKSKVIQPASTNSD